MRPLQELLPNGSEARLHGARRGVHALHEDGRARRPLHRAARHPLQMWLFIAPGLYSHEKKLAIPFVVLTTVFFVAGAAFSHYVAFPWAWRFFASFATDYMTFLPRIEPVFSLYVKMLLGMGARLPDADARALPRARSGSSRAGFLVRHFKYAVLIIFIVAAVLTPGTRRGLAGADGRADVRALLHLHRRRVGVPEAQAREPTLYRSVRVAIRLRQPRPSRVVIKRSRRRTWHAWSVTWRPWTVPRARPPLRGSRLSVARATDRLLGALQAAGAADAACHHPRRARTHRRPARAARSRRAALSDIRTWRPLRSPPCDRCSSPMTGRWRPAHSSGSRWSCSIGRALALRAAPRSRRWASCRQTSSSHCGPASTMTLTSRRMTSGRLLRLRRLVVSGMTPRARRASGPEGAAVTPTAETPPEGFIAWTSQRRDRPVADPASPRGGGAPARSRFNRRGHARGWRAARGALHQALAGRGSRVALYDLRETLESGSRRLPITMLPALETLGDCSVLDALAEADCAHEATGGRRHHLRVCCARSSSGEELTKRHAALKKIAEAAPSRD